MVNEDDNFKFDEWFEKGHFDLIDQWSVITLIRLKMHSILPSITVITRHLYKTFLFVLYKFKLVIQLKFINLLLCELWSTTKKIKSDSSQVQVPTTWKTWFPIFKLDILRIFLKIMSYQIFSFQFPWISTGGKMIDLIYANSSEWLCMNRIERKKKSQ